MFGCRQGRAEASMGGRVIAKVVYSRPVDSKALSDCITTQVERCFDSMLILTRCKPELWMSGAEDLVPAQWVRGKE